LDTVRQRPSELEQDVGGRARVGLPQFVEPPAAHHKYLTVGGRGHRGAPPPVGAEKPISPTASPGPTTRRRRRFIVNLEPTIDDHKQLLLYQSLLSQHLTRLDVHQETVPDELSHGRRTQRPEKLRAGIPGFRAPPDSIPDDRWLELQWPGAGLDNADQRLRSTALRVPGPYLASANGSRNDATRDKWERSDNASTSGTVRPSPVGTSGAA
jgi:hypothetical protein